jgi:hypothetical protein
MSGGEIFLWGVAGGLIFYFLEFIFPLRFEGPRSGFTSVHLTADLVIGVIYMIIGGTLALLLLDGSNVQASVAVVVGFAGASLLPQFVRTTAQQHARPGTGVSYQARRVWEETDDAGSRRSSRTGRIRTSLNWWTPPRIQAACAIGVFAVALLTYITK